MRPRTTAAAVAALAAAVAPAGHGHLGHQLGTSPNGQGADLPDGTFGTTQDVTVQEIQSVNR
jgi:hypothetical protein